jgi:hypothetical protein
MGSAFSRGLPSILLLALASPAFAGGEDEPPGADAILRARVSEAVGRPVEIEVGRRKSVGGWTLVCGDPVEPSGAPFDVGRSRLGSEYGAHFCGLLRSTADGEALVEFDIGSNDMPAVGWMEEHGLPAGLLSD